MSFYPMELKYLRVQLEVTLCTLKYFERIPLRMKVIIIQLNKIVLQSI